MLFDYHSFRSLFRRPLALTKCMLPALISLSFTVASVSSEALEDAASTSLVERSAHVQHDIKAHYLAQLGSPIDPFAVDLTMANTMVNLGLVTGDPEFVSHGTDESCLQTWLDALPHSEKPSIYFTDLREACGFPSPVSLADASYLSDRQVGEHYLGDHAYLHTAHSLFANSVDNSPRWMQQMFEWGEDSARTSPLASEWDDGQQSVVARPVDAIIYQQALSILTKKWQRSRKDPASLAEDIEELARYIATQPEAMALLKSLAKQPVFLHYRKGQFSSNVKGTPFAVRSVRIYFDPRSAAKLIASPQCDADPAHCAIAPADALIHELLHAQIALLKTDEFIASGGMNQLVYPHAHEQQVIRAERNIYRAMTLNDTQPRPQRQNHSGSLYDTSCVTCIDG